MSKTIIESHTKKYLPYDGHNPNNCTHCACTSANWQFTPVDQFDVIHKLCNDCISRGAIFTLGIKTNSSPNDLIKYNH